MLCEIVGDGGRAGRPQARGRAGVRPAGRMASGRAVEGQAGRQTSGQHHKGEVAGVHAEVLRAGERYSGRALRGSPAVTRLTVYRRR